MLAKVYDSDGVLIGTKEVTPPAPPQHEYDTVDAQCRAEEWNMFTLFDANVHVPSLHVVAWRMYQKSAGISRV